MAWWTPARQPSLIQHSPSSVCICTVWATTFTRLRFKIQDDQEPLQVKEVQGQTALRDVFLM